MTQLELVHAAPAEFDDTPVRGDFDVIARMVDDGASVLDVGCGDGALIHLLTRTCRARGRGLERDKTKVRGCVARGLSVVQGDADGVLADYPSATFNYVIFSHSFQSLARPREVLREAGRVGEKVIVSIRNAGHWRNRWQLVSKGRVVSPSGPHWADGELKRACSVRDFAALAREMRFAIETAIPLSKSRPGSPFAKALSRANLFAEEAVFLLTP
ncbi:MAG TPA: methionine biosynthesis protein MetW [Candidatus Binatia bacterium]|nr:methionine biosynthesis protein MetW [Candidatus Binatia bacterium]